MNHAVVPNTVTSCDRTACWLEAVSDVAKGEELTVSYGDLPDVALLQRYGFALGGRHNPIGVRLEYGGCSVDVGDESGVRAVELSCLRATGLGDGAESWLGGQCAAMLSALQAAVWPHDAAGGDAAGDTITNEPAAARLRSVWTELERGAAACARLR